jgi:hypothetical protein
MPSRTSASDTVVDAASRGRICSFSLTRCELNSDRRASSQRSNGQVLTADDAGHDIPVAVSPPHDQRAHGLPQDLQGQKRRVLTRRPLPEPSLPNRPGKCH